MSARRLRAFALFALAATAHALIDETLDVLFLSKEIGEKVLSSWDVIGKPFNATGGVELPLIRRRENQILARLAQVSRDIERIELNLEQTSAVAMLLAKSGGDARLELRLHEMTDLLNRVSAANRQMREYVRLQQSLERTTLVDFAEWCVSHDPSALPGLLERVHALVSPPHHHLLGRSILQLLLNDLQKSKKVMTKDEVSLLVDLIQSNPVLTSKETNASTNKAKEDTWAALVTTFNARSGSIPKTKDQIKLKWDNLKKAARKRAQIIRMNNLKTGGGKPDPMPVDEILDKVSSLLGSTCTGFVVPFGGDGVGGNGSNVLVLDEEYINVNEDTNLYESTEDTFTNDARSNVRDMEVLDKTPNRGIHERKRKILEVIEDNSFVPSSSNNYYGMPISDQLKTKKGKKKENDGRLARNLAIAKYYEKKTEKLDLEIKILKLELEQKENRIANNM